MTIVRPGPVFERRFMFGFLLLALVGSAGCDYFTSDATVTMLPTTTMTLGSRVFTLEKALTDRDQEKGLMDRDTLATDHGMIFPFYEDGPRQFWNHHVRFPLDLVFVNRASKVVAILRMNAQDDTPTKTVVAQYAIELNAGTAEKIGLRAGDVVALPADVITRR